MKPSEVKTSKVKTYLIYILVCAACDFIALVAFMFPIDFSVFVNTELEYGPTVETLAALTLLFQLLWMVLFYLFSACIVFLCLMILVNCAVTLLHKFKKKTKHEESIVK